MEGVAKARRGLVPPYDDDDGKRSSTPFVTKR
jgi:hypothetical protein